MRFRRFIFTGDPDHLIGQTKQVLKRKLNDKLPKLRWTKSEKMLWKSEYKSAVSQLDLIEPVCENSTKPFF